MKISNNKKIKEIQTEFNRQFPFLKLEFFDEKAVAGEGSPPKPIIDCEQTIGELRSKQVDEDLDIDGQLNIRALGQKFYELFGLNVQIFRKSGNTWLQALNSDSLLRQNHK